MVLSCALHKDLQYTRANPTFHHWRTEGKRFGLTFQSSTEARHFEKAIRRAVDSMREGSTVGGWDPFPAPSSPLREAEKNAPLISFAAWTRHVCPRSSPRREHRVHRKGCVGADFRFLLRYVITIYQRYGQTDGRSDGRHARSISATCVLHVAL